MRSIVLILATLLVVVGGFLAYSWFEPSAAPKPNRALTNLTDKPRSATTRSLRGLQIGDSVWVRRYDQKTGELSSQFKALKYTPREDGTVDVEKPEAEFFSNDGQQRIRVEGAHGNVVMNLPPEDRPGQIQGRMDTEAPSRGKLQDVTISMFDPADDEAPKLVATMNNAAFDNDTFRIATESYIDKTGKIIPGDEVPVVLRGKDYDFDGRGLVIKWNERDQKLQLLEIAHGESLTVKNPSALSHPMLAPAKGKSPTTTKPSASSAMLASTDPRAFILAAAQPAPAQPVPSKAPKKKKPKKRPVSVPATRATFKRDTSPVVYRATFEREVRIFEGGKQTVSAGAMHVDFLQAPTADSTTQPSEDEETGSVTRPAHHPLASPKPSNPPATQPTIGQVVLKWQGRLSVVPLDGPPDPTLTPGKARVQLIGSPVLLMRDGTEARAGIATFNTADESASLRASESVKEVTMTDAHGAKVTTPQLDYTTLAEERIATLTGPSRAEIPVEADSGQAENVVASWTEKCQLKLADDGRGAVTIQEARLNGAVNVDHPELKMSSDSLRLAFDPPSTTQPDTVPVTSPSTSPAKTAPAALREVAASGNVRCEIIASTDLQSIEAQNLQIAIDKAPTGQMYARRIVADGDVRTRENGRELRTGQLVAELALTTKPTSKPATTQSTPTTQAANALGGDVKLLSLLASSGVTLTTLEGQKATADKLIVASREGDEGAAEYSLIGKPLASVTDGKTTISGAAIRMMPAQKLARIEGEGALHQTNPDDPSRTEDITWTGGAVVDGNTDTIELRDKVLVKSTESDGTTNEASADKLTAKLVAQTKAQSTTEPTASTKRTTTDDMNFLAGKDIGSADLIGSVKVKSEKLAADGAIERVMLLRAETVTYDRAAGSMEVPGEGQMLYEIDAPEKATESAGPTLGGGQGKTAFGWKKSLRFDEESQQAVMRGDVKVIHHPQGKDTPPFNMTCDTLTAILEPDASAASRVATQTATTQTSRAPSFRLKRVLADGRVHVTSTRLNFDANQLSFDPNEQLLTATGDATNPITVFDNQSGSTQTASELRWNTQTDQFRIKDLGGKVRPGN